MEREKCDIGGKKFPRARNGRAGFYWDGGNPSAPVCALGYLPYQWRQGGSAQGITKKPMRSVRSSLKGASV